ncbi:MAG: ethanolamine utilization protein EutN [Deltaproteobacteria bacterium]|nr:MAG: ethanolamine utilization protein EutN [Deltaproteobacteria bacterium]
MILGRVVGDVWSTKKKEEVNALRFLFIQPYGKDLSPKEELIVAADEIGAGIGEMVIVTQGAPAMQAFKRDTLLPIDAVVIGIVDSLEMPE